MSDEESDEFFASADEGSDDNFPYWSTAQKNIGTSCGGSKSNEPPSDHNLSGTSIPGIDVLKNSSSNVPGRVVKFNESSFGSISDSEEPKSLETSADTSDDANILNSTVDPTRLGSERSPEMEISTGFGVSNSAKVAGLSLESESPKSETTNHIQVSSWETDDNPPTENMSKEPQTELRNLLKPVELAQSDAFTTRDWEVEPWASSLISESEKLDVDFSINKSKQGEKSVESTVKIEDEDAWKLEGGFWATSSKAEPHLAKKSIEIKALNLGDEGGWYVEGDSRTSPRSANSEDKTTRETSTKPEKYTDENVYDVEDNASESSQPVKLKVASLLAQNELINVEDGGGWDLENDPWASAEIIKKSETKQNDRWAVEDWDSGDELLTKSSSTSYPPKELASAATSLVKTVGGGIANFVEGFKLSNLSSTLAAFEEKPVTGVSSQPASSTSASGESGDSGGIGLGWSSWDLGSLAKALTSTVESTGMQIINGGVDVLEHIGKKTFTALKENDPGLVYTKRILRPIEATHGPQLSQVSQILREASERYAAPGTVQSASSERTATTGAAQVEALRGDLASHLESRLALVHIEALELLGSRASARLTTKLARLEAEEAEHASHAQSLAAQGVVLERISQTLQLKELEGCGERASAGASMADALAALYKVTPANALLKAFENAQLRSKEADPNEIPMQEIFFRAIETLAETTAAVLAYLHKLAECLMLLGQHRECLDRGFLDIARQIVSVVFSAKLQNESICSTYVEHLRQAVAVIKKRKDGDSSSAEPETGDALTASRRMVASLFLETGTANGYLDDATTDHLVPVLQMACLDSFFPDHSASTPPSSAAFLKAKKR